jgi:hypothetical protein
MQIQQKEYLRLGPIEKYFENQKLGFKLRLIASHGKSQQLKEDQIDIKIQYILRKLARYEGDVPKQIYMGFVVQKMLNAKRLVVALI